jgi:hypothetical protein
MSPFPRAFGVRCRGTIALAILPAVFASAPGGVVGADADPSVASMLDGITADSLLAHVDRLVAFGTRRWDQPGGREAEEWIGSFLQGLPLDDVFIHDFNEGSDNVFGVLLGRLRPDRAHVIGAHYDSLNSTSPTAPAPGADDNASGTAAVLEAARVMATSGRRPAETIVFAFFSAEEAMVVGSRAFVKTLASRPWTVVDMIGIDVIGYVKPGTIPDLSVSSNVFTAGVQELIGKLRDSAAAYLPDWPFEGGPGCG